MSVHPTDIERARDVLVKAGASRVLLFGSAMTSPEQARDIDLACSGIPPPEFFAVYGKLIRAVDVPVDLVDLDQRTAFARLVEKRGRVLYERI